jgi:hypothetical protein
MTRRRSCRFRGMRLWAWTSALLVLGGCATWTPSGDTADTSLRARAVTQVSRQVQVSAAVLGADDSRRILGSDVTAFGVQPVWVEVANGSDRPLWLLRSGADPDYFSPLEVAWSAHVTFGGDLNDRIDDHFDRLGFPNPVPAGGTTSGLLFTNPQSVTKVLNIDLLGDETLVPFTLFLPVPGEAQGGLDLLYRYGGAGLPQHDDLATLWQAIEALPCCGEGAAGPADPVNLVFVGRFEDIAASLIRRGYRNDAHAREASQQLFGRPPDVVVRKRATLGGPAHWLRIWRAPMDHLGQPVVAVQAGRPVGGRLAKDATAGATLYPDVDETRNMVVQDLMYSGGLAKLGFAAGAGRSPAGGPGQAAGSGEYVTDGRRAALFFGMRPRDFSDVEVLDWEPIVPAEDGRASGRQQP